MQLHSKTITVFQGHKTSLTAQKQHIISQKCTSPIDQSVKTVEY